MERATKILHDLIGQHVPAEAISVNRHGTLVINLAPQPKRCKGVIFLPNEDTFTEARCPEMTCAGQYCANHEYLVRS
jgi:hypothetical protein